jgi:hypothetical protein
VLQHDQRAVINPRKKALFWGAIVILFVLLEVSDQIWDGIAWQKEGRSLLWISIKLPELWETIFERIVIKYCAEIPRAEQKLNPNSPPRSRSWMVVLPEFSYTPSGSAQFITLIRHHVAESLVSDGHLDSRLLQYVIIGAPAQSTCCCKSQKTTFWGAAVFFLFLLYLVKPYRFQIVVLTKGLPSLLHLNASFPRQINRKHQLEHLSFLSAEIQSHRSKPGSLSEQCGIGFEVNWRVRSFTSVVATLGPPPRYRSAFQRNPEMNP